MTKYFMYLFAVILLLAGSDCKKNPVGPPPPNGSDTTSHAISWYVDTLGAQGYVNDVWVFANNNVWAVGQIYLNDSTGKPDMSNPYNCAHWDGNKWALIKIPTALYGGSIYYASISTIFAFSENNIWTFCNAGSYSQWNGTAWKTEYVPARSGGGNKLWGSTSSNLYLVGTNGSISHYDGSTWTQMNSNTIVDLQDVWGTDANHIWATGTTVDYSRSIVLSFDGTNWTPIYDSATQPLKMQFAFSSLWTDTKNDLWLAGGIPLQQLNLSSNTFTGITTGQAWPSSCIRGLSEKDLFIVGQDGECAHYNGLTWYLYPDLKAMNNGSALVLFLTVCPTQHFVALGGQFFTGSNGFPVVIRGYR